MFNKYILALVFSIASIGITAGEGFYPDGALKELFKQCPEYKISVRDEVTVALAMVRPGEMVKCPALAKLPTSEYQRCVGDGFRNISGLEINKGMFILDHGSMGLVMTAIGRCSHLKSRSTLI